MNVKMSARSEMALRRIVELRAERARRALALAFDGHSEERVQALIDKQREMEREQSAFVTAIIAANPALATSAALAASLATEPADETTLANDELEGA